ncbi:SHOCT domain-containing protein [Halobacillus sp. ACCC02827]|uniref:SHOCT domain-containing protein n=1 Tax=Halobacillus sp. ACCC02827 TaxID=3052090 RepID=UPI00256FE8C1|nr:SHOCT domain-containing protein [Halobacillus sp. ACCC02827]WJE15278.1 SHOCT domain-containing protein [Halobacillus sp. ACCC02827]
MWTFIGIVGVIIMVIGVYGYITNGGEDWEKKVDGKVELAFQSQDITPTQLFKTRGNYIIAVDENKEKICFLVPSKVVIRDVSDFKIFNMNYQDLMEVEVKVDGETVTKTSRSSQLAGVAIGGLLAGGAGAVIGGLSGKTTSSEKVRSIQLNIVINNTENPFHSFEFLKVTEAKKQDIQYKAALDMAMHWQSLLKVIIGIADKRDKQKVTNHQHMDHLFKTGQVDSLADELRKMHELFSDGIISQEEYDVQRKRMLN